MEALQAGAHVLEGHSDRERVRKWRGFEVENKSGLEARVGAEGRKSGGAGGEESCRGIYLDYSTAFVFHDERVIVRFCLTIDSFLLSLPLLSCIPR